MKPQSLDVRRLDLAGVIRNAGGRTRVARAVGVSYHAVRAWQLGHAQPRAPHLSAILALRAAPPLRGGRPPVSRDPEAPVLFSKLLFAIGSVSQLAKVLGCDRRTLRRYARGDRAPTKAMKARAAALLATWCGPSPSGQPA